MVRRRLILALVFAATVAVSLTPTLAQAPLPAESAALSGWVTDARGRPLRNAEILIDGMLATHTLDDGTFHVFGIPPGSHQVRVTAPRHYMGNKMMQFEAGRALTLRVRLRAFGEAAGGAREVERHGTFVVHVHPYRDGNRRYRVSHVEVYDSENPSADWSQYSYEGNDGTGLAVTCSNAPLDATYVIHVLWRGHSERRGADEDDYRDRYFYRRPFADQDIIDIYGP